VLAQVLHERVTRGNPGCQIMVSWTVAPPAHATKWPDRRCPMARERWCSPPTFGGSPHHGQGEL